MKNSFRKILVTLILSLNPLSLSFAEDFIFETPEIKITEKGDVYNSNKRGKAITDNQIQITSNNFEYLKKINQLEANGDVILIDPVNKLIMGAQKIFYLKNEEKIYTVGKTIVIIEGEFKEYTVEGYDLVLLKNKMILYSDEKTIISDNFSNIYKLDEFEYSINQEILKGKKIDVITNIKNNENEKYFFESGFFDLKKNKFLAKDISVKLHKTLFGDVRMDPRFSAAVGTGDEFNTYYDKGVFTSCKKTDKCPPWQMRSRKIHHDKIKKQIAYTHAWLEVYDYPVFYFPRFFHPDPTVKRQSGFLKPEISDHDTLGDSIYTPYFHVISKDKDITIKPRLFNDNKFVLQSEYRQKTKNSFTVADFSILRGHSSGENQKDATRTHLFTHTMIKLGLDKFEDSMLEINYEKTSNDNYLKLFKLKSPILGDTIDTLQSIVKLDLEHKKYSLITSVEMYEALGGLNSDRYQYVLPTYDFSTNFDLDKLDGSFNFSSNGNNTLSATNVVTSSIINDLNFNSYNTFLDNGIKNNYEIQVKNINSAGKNSVLYKASPQSEIISSYIFNTSLPLYKKTKKTINTFEPKISFKFNPHDMKDNKHVARRIDNGNIFSSSRLSLGNSFEGGESATIGVDFKKQKISTKNKIDEIEDYFNFQLATVYRLREEENIPVNSTLNKKTSNIFGAFGYTPIKNLELSYNFSLNNDLNYLEYNAITAKIIHNNLNTQFDFLEERGIVGQSNIVENTTSYTFNEENTLAFKTRRDRKLHLTEYYDLVYEYKNDCLEASIKYRKDFYNDADIKPLEELFFTITIIPLTSFSPDKFGLSDYKNKYNY